MSAARLTPEIDYNAIVQHYTSIYHIRIRRWRKAMSGVAYRITYPDGRRRLFVESPRPRTPLSLAVFLHEVGHHAIGFDTYRDHCREEFQAWQFALRHMRRLGVPVNDRVRRRVTLSMQYAVAKASRRGETIASSLRVYRPAA